MVKPIQDALNGLVYEDDRQITHTSVTKAPIDGPQYVRGASLVMLEAFSRGNEFVYVKVELAPETALTPKQL